MEAISTARDRIAVLSKEIDGIHFVNVFYWARGETATLEARAAYERRHRRLDEIRNELFQLRSSGL